MIMNINVLRKLLLLPALLAWFGSSAHAFYDASVGRWFNRDPLGEPGFELAGTALGGGATDGPNAYLFVQNEPIARIDSWGLKHGNPVPPCAPYPDCLEWYRPPPPPPFKPSCETDCILKCGKAHLAMRLVCAIGCAGAGPAYLACVSPCMAGVSISQAICTAACIGGSSGKGAAK